MYVLTHFYIQRFHHLCETNFQSRQHLIIFGFIISQSTPSAHHLLTAPLLHNMLTSNYEAQVSQHLRKPLLRTSYKTLFHTRENLRSDWQCESQTATVRKWKVKNWIEPFIKGAKAGTQPLKYSLQWPVNKCIINIQSVISTGDEVAEMI